MPVSDGYIEFARDLLAPFEPLRIKRMFGGAGVYSEGLFFAILADDTLYLKVDDLTRPDYEACDLHPFTYTTKNGRTASMSYYPVPPHVLDEPEALAEWSRKAVETARRALNKPTAGR